MKRSEMRSKLADAGCDPETAEELLIAMEEAGAAWEPEAPEPDPEMAERLDLALITFGDADIVPCATACDSRRFASKAEMAEALALYNRRKELQAVADGLRALAAAGASGVFDCEDWARVLEGKHSVSPPPPPAT